MEKIPELDFREVNASEWTTAAPENAAMWYYKKLWSLNKMKRNWREPRAHSWQILEDMRCPGFRRLDFVPIVEFDVFATYPAVERYPRVGKLGLGAARLSCNNKS